MYGNKSPRSKGKIRDNWLKRINFYAETGVFTKTLNILQWLVDRRRYVFVIKEMRRVIINCYEEAVERLRWVTMAYDAGDFSDAFDMMYDLAYYVSSADTKSTVPVERLEALTEEVKRALGRFSFCEDEGIWEDASSLWDLFR